jgi:cellulose synthase/poly-beta-1,6-N-acetylglucosamine synthase-like glycosyltransferase
MVSIAKNFFIPNSFNREEIGSRFLVGVIIPSYKPTDILLDLVSKISQYGDMIDICVVDDSTPKECRLSHDIFEVLRTDYPKVTILRTDRNMLKAGALNRGLSYFFSKEGEEKPDAIFTLDDDVRIAEDTIQEMVKSLFADERIGAVCSQARVLNKNTNLLTRLQGLEYQGFNALRVADEGFLYGPLVMHGMLSVFRTKAIEETGYFVEGHLIEDYEITARLKLYGWHVRMAKNARAWTNVPETFGDLWKQRARWTCGGLLIITDRRYAQVIFQDIIGHILFLSTLILVILSLSFPYNVEVAISEVIYGIVIISLLQTLLSYVFSLWYMKRYYNEKDVWDWILRGSLIPEFIYANILSIVLLGAYLYIIAEVFILHRDSKNKFILSLVNLLQKGFLHLGYARGWGTR